MLSASPATSSCAGSCSTSCPRACTRSVTSACGTIPGANKPPGRASCCNSIAQQHGQQHRRGPWPPVQPPATRTPTLSGPVLNATRAISSASGAYPRRRRADHEPIRHLTRAALRSSMLPSRRPRQPVVHHHRWQGHLTRNASPRPHVETASTKTRRHDTKRLRPTPPSTPCSIPRHSRARSAASAAEA